MLLEGKFAIVTGAASARGIGRATAQAFVDQGAKVAILDIDAQAASDAAATLGEGHIGIAVNVADEAQVRDAVAQVLAHFGRIDVLVNNAGITQPVKTLEITGPDYDRIL